MNLNVKWHKPIPMVDGDDHDLIYTAAGLEACEGMAGVYMFCRIFNDKAIPLYIGRAENIASRVRQHFKSSTRLMKGLSKASKGARVMIAGEFVPKPGQATGKCIAVIERALIEHALTEGYELFNVQGTKTPTHQLHFSGFLGARNLTGKQLNIKAG